MPVYTDRTLLKMQETGGLVTTGAVSPQTAVAQAHSEYFTFDKLAADAMASTATAETFTGIFVGRAGRIKSITASLPSALTGDNTNNAVITFSKRDFAGANLTTVATLTTNVATGNFVAGAGKNVTLPNDGTEVLTAGATFTFSIAKGGTGVVVPISRYTIEVEYI